MELEVLEVLLAAGTDLQQIVVGHPPVLEVVRRLPIEQNHRTGGRLRAERGALANRLLEFSAGVAVAVLDRHHPVFDAQGRTAVFRGEGRYAILGLSLEDQLLVAFPSGARQPAAVADQTELPVAQRDHLSSALQFRFFGLHQTDVFTLHGEIRSGLGRIGRDLRGFLGGRRRGQKRRHHGQRQHNTHCSQHHLVSVSARGEKQNNRHPGRHDAAATIDIMGRQAAVCKRPGPVLDAAPQFGG